MFRPCCPSLSMTTHHLCLHHKASQRAWVYAFNLGARAHTHTHTHLLGTASCLPQIRKSCPLVCHRRGFWQLVAQPQAPSQPLLNKTSPDIPLSPSVESACQAAPVCSHCFQELCISFHRGLLCAWEQFSVCICSSSFPSLVLSRAHVQDLPQLNI